MLLPLLLTALAAPFTVADPTAAMAGPGVVLLDIPKPGACSVDGWDTVTLPAGASAIRLDPRKQGDVVRAIVGDGPYLPPMTLAYKDGAAVDRVCGCWSADELTAWVSGLAAGTTWADQLAGTLATTGRPDTNGWLRLVERHHCADRDPAAFDALMHLWTSIPVDAPDQRAVRLSRVAHDMAVLSRANEEVSARVAALRDGLEATIQTDPVAADDWVALNRVLLDDARTVQLYEDHKADPSWTRALQHIGSSLFVLLVERDRWADAALVLPEPMAWLESVQPASGGLELALDGYASLLAAGREKEATAYAKELLKVGPDDTACRMVARALDAEQPRKAHKGLLKGCDAGLVTRYEAALP